MGNFIFQTLQSSYVSYHPPTTNTVTTRRQLPPIDNQTKTIKLKQIIKDMNYTVYLASVCGVNFTIRRIDCPIPYGCQVMFMDEPIYGLVRYANHEMHFKKRIPILKGQNAALQEFCMRKALSILDAGQSIGHILGADVEVYPTFLQYAGQILAGKRFINNHSEMVEDRMKTLKQLSNRHLSVEQPDGLLEYSLVKKRFVYRNAQLIWKERGQWQEIPVVEPPLEPEARQVVGSLSIQSRVNMDKTAAERQFQLLLRSFTQNRQKLTYIQQKLNILQNHIYNYKCQQQTKLRYEIETVLHYLPQDGTQKSLIYFKCLQSIYQRVNRHKQQIQILKHIISKQLNPDFKSFYRRKLAYFMNEDSVIKRLLLSSQLNYQNPYFHLALGKISLSRQEKKEAMMHLTRGCEIQTHNDNSCYLEAAEILYKWGHVEQAQGFLKKGIRKGISINGPLHITNSRFYKAMGLLRVKQSKFQKGLKCFQYAREILSRHRIINNQYFSIISDQLVVCDMLRKQQRIREIESELTNYASHIRRQMHPSQYIVIFSNIGSALFCLNQPREARTIFSQCLKFPYLLDFLDNESYIKTYSNLACMQMKDKDYEKAQKYFKLAQKRQKQSFLTRKDVVDVWLSYHLHNNIAMLYYQKGQFKNSLAQFQQVLYEAQHFDQSDKAVKQSLIHLYFNISFLNHALLKTDMAIKYIDESLKTATELYGSQHPMTRKIQGQIDSFKKMVIIEIPNEEDSRPVSYGSEDN